MIAGSIAHSDSEKMVLPRAVVRGIEFLETHKIEEMDPGRYDIDGDNLFVLIQDYTTVPQKEKRPEAHDQYLDIQYIASGTETIGWSIRSTDVVIAENLAAEKDVVFFGTIQDETDIILSAGMYAVFFPNDIHRPGCVYKQPSAVRKAVVKIRMSLL